MISEVVRKKVVDTFDDYIQDYKSKQVRSFSSVEHKFLNWLLARGWINQDKLLDDIKDIERIRDIRDEGKIKVGNLTMEVTSVQQAFGSKKHGRHWQDGTVELEIEPSSEVLDFFESIMNDMHEDIKREIGVLEDIKDKYSLSESEIGVIDSQINILKHHIENNNETFNKTKK